MLDNTTVATHLGKTSQYKGTYDPTLLVAEPRSNNRKHIGITDDTVLPFYGIDVWNAYEISTLNKNGLPVVGVARIVYPANSNCIVESKSLKLYLNSFNMTRSLHTEPKDVLTDLRLCIIQDLKRILEASFVDVTLVDASSNQMFETEHLPTRYKTIETELISQICAVECTEYHENPSILKVINTTAEAREYRIHSALLKSNCRVTSQPDWGDVYIRYVGQGVISYESLLKYIISFRDENHFHEEICETIFMRLQTVLSLTGILDDLEVTCLYLRRGGVDINPTRSLGQKIYTTAGSILSTKTLRQ